MSSRKNKFYCSFVLNTFGIKNFLTKYKFEQFFLEMPILPVGVLLSESSVLQFYSYRPALLTIGWIAGKLRGIEYLTSYASCLYETAKANTILQHHQCVHTSYICGRNNLRHYFRFRK